MRDYQPLPEDLRRVANEHADILAEIVDAIFWLAEPRELPDGTYAWARRRPTPHGIDHECAQRGIPVSPVRAAFRYSFDENSLLAPVIEHQFKSNFHRWGWSDEQSPPPPYSDNEFDPRI